MTKPSFPVVAPTAPQSLSFRCEIYNANTEFLPHAHSYGQLICVKAGVLAMNIGGQRFLAPPEFSVWVPAGVEHSSFNRKSMHFRAIDIALELCDELQIGVPNQYQPNLSCHCGRLLFSWLINA